MSMRSRVLELLEKHRDKNISGEQIAQMLGVSRNMVWRAIKELRLNGYQIEAATNKGYRLCIKNDIISVEGIKPFLSHPDMSDSIKVFGVIDSTNREAKSQAVNKAPHGTVIIADSQTSGRGRFSRGFFSPPATGLYMSFVLHAGRLGFVSPTTITAYAGLCVCEAIERTCGIVPSIKWVNDIFLGGKKVGGILTEAITDFESGNIHEIILGIGINVSTKQKDFPPGFRQQAGSLYPEGKGEVTRNQIAAEVINRVLAKSPPAESVVFEEYSKRLFMLGANITVTQGGDSYRAMAINISDKGDLVVQLEDGSLRLLSFGEISIHEAQ